MLFLRPSAFFWRSASAFFDRIKQPVTLNGGKSVTGLCRCVAAVERGGDGLLPPRNHADSQGGGAMGEAIAPCEVAR